MRSENVGMSNRNGSESLPHRKPKVSLAMMIIQGLGGPNLAPEYGEGMDRRLIFLPLVPCFYGMTKSSSSGELSDFCSLHSPPCRKASWGVSRQPWRKPGKPSKHSSRKSLKDMSGMSPYRKPTQVGWRKCAKVNV